MIITGIDIYKGDTMYIEIDNDERIFLHRSIVSEYHLKKGMDIPQPALEEVIKANEFRKARERALYLLDNRDYGYVELFHKLEKSYDEDICYEVCNRMAELGLINDRRYALQLAEYYLCTKKYGRFRAKMEMSAKGIDGQIAEDALDEFAEGTLERLEELVEKKYERYLDSRKGVEKVKSALARMGYSYSEIKEVLDIYELDFDE